MKRIASLILNNLVKSLIVFVFFSECSTKEPAQKDSDFLNLEKVLLETKNYKLSDSIKVVFVLTEKECMTCCEKFADFAKLYLDDEKILFLIYASGTGIDISAFEERKSNVLFFEMEELATQQLSNASKAVFLSKKHVDTIIEIQTFQLEKQLDNIKKRISKSHF